MHKRNIACQYEGILRIVGLDPLRPPKHVPQRAVSQGPSKKTIHIPQDPSFNSNYACWRFKYLQLVDPHGWHHLRPDQLELVRSKLAEFERKTWNEIFVRERRRNHSITIDKVTCPQARRRLKEILPLQEELWSIRLSGPERIWGVLEAGIFHLLWWDPHHLICASLLG
jgi:hypothetical protein